MMLSYCLGLTHQQHAELRLAALSNDQGYLPLAPQKEPTICCLYTYRPPGSTSLSCKRKGHRNQRIPLRLYTAST